MSFARLGIILLVLIALPIPTVLANSSASSDLTIAGTLHPGSFDVSVLATANDPIMPDQWYLSRLNIPRAWDVTTGNQTTVAVIDTGINRSHVDLQNRLWVNSDEVGGNGIDDDHNGYTDDVNGYNFVDNNSSLTDQHGHGTGIASIIAAQTNNHIGLAGINWQAKLMIIKALNQTGGGDFNDVINSIRYAVDNGAKIINMSFGSPSSDISLEQAIDYATSRGVLVVAASGNTYSSQVFYPAAYPAVIAVGATTHTDSRAEFSNYGSSLDVVAPGEDIVVAGLGGNDYLVGAGSSFAAAQITGVTSLILARYPQLNIAQTDQLLKSSAHLSTSGPTQQLGFGIPDAYKSVSSLATNISASFTKSPSSLAANGISQTIVTATITSDSGPVTNTAMTLTVSGSTNIVNNTLLPAGGSLNLGPTNSSGQITFSLSSTTAEVKTISLSAISAGLVVPATTTVNFTAPPQPSHRMSWVGQSSYPTLSAGQTASLWLEVKNTGNVAWVADAANRQAPGLMKLGTDRPFDRNSTFYTNSWLSPNRAALMQPSIVRPNEIARFEFPITASSPGSFREYFRPVIEYVAWTNDLGIYWDITVTGSSTTTPGAAHTYQAAVISKSNDLTLKPGSIGVVAVELRNTGTSTWLGTGNSFGTVKVGTSSPRDRASQFYLGNWLSANRIMTMGFDVRPSQTITLTFSLLAPQTPGTYTERFSLVSEYITWFGPEFSWAINVQP